MLKVYFITIAMIILLPIAAAIYACFIGVFTTLTTFCAFIEGGIKGLLHVYKIRRTVGQNDAPEEVVEAPDVWEKHIARMAKNKTKNSGE